MAGMEIDPANMRGRPAALAARGWAVSLALGMAVGAVMWATGAIGAPVLVGLALTTTALGALVPILKDAQLADHPVGRLAFASGAAGEFGPIVALSIILAVASGEPWRTVLLVVFAVIAVAAGLLATRVRPVRIVRLVEATMHSSGQLALRLALLLLAGLVVLAGSLGLDVVLGAFSAGFIVGLVARGQEAEAFHVKLDAVGFGFLIPIFFISTGIGFDLDALLGSATTLLLVPLFAALFLLVRGVPAWLFSRSELPRRERTALAFLTASALPLVVAITEVATDSGHLAQEDAAALVGAAMLSLLAFPLARDRADQTLTSSPVANISAMPGQQAGDGDGMQRATLVVAQGRCELHDHLDDRAGAEAEQERGEAGVERGRPDPRAEHGGRPRDQAEERQPPDRRAQVRDRRDDGEPLGRVVEREADDEEAAERQRSGRVRGADRDALAEVVQADAGRDEQRELCRPTRRRAAARARPRRPSRARNATAAPSSTSAAPPNACDPSPASSRPSSVASIARNASSPIVSAITPRSQPGGMRRIHGSQSIPSAIGITPT